MRAGRLGSGSATAANVRLLRLAVLLAGEVAGSAGAGCAAVRSYGDVQLWHAGHAITIRLPPCLAELTSPLVGVERQTCIGESLNQLVAGTAPRSPGAAVCAAQAMVAARVLPSCHYTAHAIGSAVWDYVHRSITITDTASLLSVVAAAFEYCTFATCVYGCVHRIMVRTVVSSSPPPPRAHARGHRSPHALARPHTAVQFSLPPCYLAPVIDLIA